MISVTLPDERKYVFKPVVFDYNGTLTEDGLINNEVRRLLAELAAKVHVAVITADTFGTVQSQLQELADIEVIILEPGVHGAKKAYYVQLWGPENTVVIGSGANDQPMFSRAGLKICVLGPEGASSSVLATSDIVVKCPEEAIKLLLNHKRLIATLRR